MKCFSLVTEMLEAPQRETVKGEAMNIRKEINYSVMYAA